MEKSVKSNKQTPIQQIYLRMPLHFENSDIYFDHVIPTFQHDSLVIPGN